jgi:sporulation protein YlmC with PRC-barrel domain
MLLSAKHLSGFKIEASDGEIGHLDNFFIDDRNWVVRYVVVDIGSWLEGRKILIAPGVAGNPDGEIKHMPIHLTKNQIEKSPEIDTDMPVSRRQEIKLHEHYQWQPYWIGGIPPVSPVLPPKTRVTKPETTETSRDEDADPHLRSINEMIRYSIHASDGEIGHVADFVVDSEDWVIRYLVVDTRNWLPGKHVIIAPDWIEKISWAESAVTVSMTKASIEDSPEYNPGLPINMEYERRLYDYYGRPKYWE